MTATTERVRVTVEGCAPVGGDTTPFALIIGDQVDCAGLDSPEVVTWEAARPEQPWERDALVGALQAIADGRHTGDGHGGPDFSEHCPTCGVRAYAQEVLGRLGLQFAGQDAEVAAEAAPSGMSAKVLHLVANRGGLDASAGSILGQIAPEVGCTRERALQIIRQLERDQRIVIERDGARPGNPVVKVRLA